MITVVLAVAASAAHAAVPVSVESVAADVPAVVEQAKSQAAAGRVLPAFGRELPPSYWVEGCQRVTFDARSGLLSDPIKLESVQYQEFCRGTTPDGMPDCWTDRVREEKRTVRVQLEGRGLLQGRQKEVFKVCLMETALQASLVRGTSGYEFIMPKRSSDPIIARAKKDGLF